LHLLLSIRQIIEPVHVQAFISQAAVEGFDLCIARRLSGTRKLKRYLVRIDPQIDHAARKLTAEVAVNYFRCAPFSGQLVQDPGDVLTTEMLSRFND